MKWQTQLKHKFNIQHNETCNTLNESLKSLQFLTMSERVLEKYSKNKRNKIRPN